MNNEKKQKKNNLFTWFIIIIIIAFIIAVICQLKPSVKTDFSSYEEFRNYFIEDIFRMSYLKALVMLSIIIIIQSLEKKYMEYQ